MVRHIYGYKAYEGIKIAAVEYIPPYKVLIHLMDGRTIKVEPVIRHECIDKPARDECAVLDVIEYEAGEM
jgi:hypothetical protein